MNFGKRIHPFACGLVASAALLTSQPAQAERAADEPRDNRGDRPMREIVVKGQALGQEGNSFSTTTLSEDEIRERRVTEVQELFRQVPGMNVRDYNLSGVANQIVIRGFGNGAHGGDLGMVIDGIPLNEANSHADGYADANVLIPLEIADLTVYRGPVSALYGNFNRGGLIAYETRKGDDYAEADASYGDFYTFDVQGALGLDSVMGGAFNGAIQYFQTDGFRPQSDADRLTIAGRYAIDLSDALDLSASVRYQTAEGNSPAYLTFGQYQVDPYGIDPRVKNDGSKKDFLTARADLGYSISYQARLLGYFYTTQQDFVRYFTRGPADQAANWRQREERYDRKVYGGGVNLNGNTEFASTSVAYVIGVEAFSEDTQFQFYEDLDFRRRRSLAQFNRTLTLDSISAFGQADVRFSPLLNVTLGFRYDRFTGECEADGVEVPGGACGEFDAVDSFSPRIGVQSQVAPWLQLRANFSQGFALPEAQAKFATGAQGLDPNTIRQFEAGLRLTPLARFELDMVGYRVNSTNEFASPAPGEFINFGETRRTGFEASLKWRPVEQVDLRVAYSYTDSKVEENLDPALIGKSVTGVPDHMLTIDGRVSPFRNLTLSGILRYVGEYATDGLNTVYAPDYTVLDVGASYELADLLNVPSRIYLDIENVGDVVYASSFNSLGSIAAGSPRFVQVGVQIGF